MTAALEAHRRLLARLTVRTHCMADDKPADSWQQRQNTRSGGVRSAGTQRAEGSGGHNRRRISVRGEEFASVLMACDCLGVHSGVIRRWLKQGIARFLD